MAARQVITIATGKKLFADLAVNLARSFFLWHNNSDIRFQLVTDIPQYIPEDIKDRIEIILVTEDEIGKGFSTKLHLDKLTTEGQTLFIDSDCLIYRDLDPVFEKFKGHKVSVVGGYIAKGEWFGDVEQVCKHFNIQHMPKFNGGVYYIQKGEEASKVYNDARSIEQDYDKIGFVRLRNRPNDEVILSVAMELNGQQPVADDGSIHAEFVNFASGIKSDLLGGFAELYNNPSHVNYRPGWQLTSARPAIVHFLGHYNQVMPYIQEAAVLKHLYVDKWTASKAKLITYIKIALPYYAKQVVKNSFRPVYRALFGARKIKRSERIVD